MCRDLCFIISWMLLKAAIHHSFIEIISCYFTLRCWVSNGIGIAILRLRCIYVHLVRLSCERVYLIASSSGGKGRLLLSLLVNCAIICIFGSRMWRISIFRCWNIIILSLNYCSRMSHLKVLLFIHLQLIPVLWCYFWCFYFFTYSFWKSSYLKTCWRQCCHIGTR